MSSIRSAFPPDAASRGRQADRGPEGCEPLRGPRRQLRSGQLQPTSCPLPCSLPCRSCSWITAVPRRCDQQNEQNGDPSGRAFGHTGSRHQRDHLDAGDAGSSTERRSGALISSATARHSSSMATAARRLLFQRRRVVGLVRPPPQGVGLPRRARHDQRCSLNRPAVRADRDARPQVRLRLSGAVPPSRDPAHRSAPMASPPTSAPGCCGVSPGAGRCRRRRAGQVSVRGPSLGTDLVGPAASASRQA